MAALLGPFLLVLSVVIIISMRMRRDRAFGHDIYVINKNSHYSYRNSAAIPYKFSVAPNILKFDAIFADGCDYDSRSVGKDINKLYGVSYGFDHHYRSVRIGWRYDSYVNKIELFSYCYIKGKREVSYLANVNQYETFSVLIVGDTNKNKVYIELETCNRPKKIRVVIDGIDKSWSRFILFPYFGGDLPAPHKVKIIVKQY